MSLDERLNRVCDFIQQNLDEELTLDILSDVAALSKFHFHRVFLAETGMTLYRFIQMSRLKRASHHIAFRKDRKVIDIAIEAGFDSPEAFTRAFKRTFGQSPSQFRNKPEWESWYAKYTFTPPRGEVNLEVKIIDFKETKVAVTEHKGAPEKVLETAGKFIEWRKSTGLSPVKTSRTFGIAYDDPKTTPADDFRFDICGEITQNVPENSYGIITKTIPNGRCAVIRHLGSLDNVSDTIYQLYREWLKNSGEELRDFPCFFHYITLVPEVDECDLITDIYLPLK